MKWEEVDVTEESLKRAVSAFIGMAVRWMYAQGKVDRDVERWVDNVELEVAAKAQKLTDSLGVIPYLVNRILDAETRLQAQVDAIRLALVIRDIEEKRARKSRERRSARDWEGILRVTLKDWSLPLDDSSIATVSKTLASPLRGQDWRSALLDAIEPRFPRAGISTRRMSDLQSLLDGNLVRDGRLKQPSDMLVGWLNPPSPAEYLLFVSSCMSPSDASLRAKLNELFKPTSK